MSAPPRDRPDGRTLPGHLNPPASPPASPRASPRAPHRPHTLHRPLHASSAQSVWKQALCPPPRKASPEAAPSLSCPCSRGWSCVSRRVTGICGCAVPSVALPAPVAAASPLSPAVGQPSHLPPWSLEKTEVVS